MKRQSLFLMAGTVLATGFYAASALASPWSFGVMSDTQWVTADPLGQNPNSVPVSIINQVNPQFISAGVKFVVQVGDLTDNGTNAAIASRATAAQPLIDAGIGYFPYRGNHETNAGASNSYGIPAVQANFPQTQGGTFTKTDTSTFSVGANFNSPTSVDANLAGMSYSFDYNNSRFVIIDNWATPAHTGGDTVNDQQSWISSQLNTATRSTTQAFVFSHQNLIGENHTDTLFGSNAASNPTWQNNFIGSLASNNVKYYISGHDHVDQNSIITSPDGLSKVHEIIGASDSNKFYTPSALSGHGTDTAGYNSGLLAKNREMPIAQQLFRVGYYIYTVDGPCVTVDYYASAETNAGTGGTTPTLHFSKQQTFGYSLNGKEFTVAQGAAFNGGAVNVATGATGQQITDAIAAGSGFAGTSAAILGGSNGSTAKDSNNRAFTMDVNTGWTTRTAGTWSDILHVWGMTGMGDGVNPVTDQTDQYVLSLHVDPAVLTLNPAQDYLGYLKNGTWANAVDGNYGGTATFVNGSWAAGMGLGTYGVDVGSNTAWAVINHSSDFALVPEPGSSALLVIGLGAMFRARSRSVRHLNKD